MLAGEASRSALISFSVGAELFLSLWTATLGATALLLMLGSLHWRGLLAAARELPAER